jgi:hypothetical protein
MSYYNNNRATPGNKANLRLLLQKELLRQYYSAFNTSQVTDNILNADQITEGTLCQCLPFRANPVKQGYNDPSQTENNRIASILTGTLGGKITYGNLNKPAIINYLGGREGQPGGLPRPMRNSF